MHNIFLLLLSALLFPEVSFAAPRTFAELVNRIVTIIDLIIPALISGAIVLFMYNILGSFGFLSGDSESGFDRAKFRTAATWGIVIIFIIVSIWGILQLMQSTFFSSNSFASPAFDNQVDPEQFR